jgi:TolA-binding protein
MIDGKWPNKKLARKYLQRVLDDYPTTPSAVKARQLLDQLGSTTKATATTRAAPD